MVKSIDKNASIMMLDNGRKLIFFASDFKDLRKKINEGKFRENDKIATLSSEDLSLSLIRRTVTSSSEDYCFLVNQRNGKERIKNYFSQSQLTSEESFIRAMDVIFSHYS